MRAPSACCEKAICVGDQSEEKTLERSNRLIHAAIFKDGVHSNETLLIIRRRIEVARNVKCRESGRILYFYSLLLVLPNLK